jgi:hypothetical protein
VTVSAVTDDLCLRGAVAAPSVAACSRRSAARSSSAEPLTEPASPMSARAAARRLSIRSEPSASSLMRTSSPALSLSRFRRSAGRTSRPRLSSRALPFVRVMWEIVTESHYGAEMGAVRGFVRFLAHCGVGPALSRPTDGAREPCQRPHQRSRSLTLAAENDGFARDQRDGLSQDHRVDG